MPIDREKLLNDPKAFRQRVRMAAVQVTGLRPEELEVALAYEVEPFSGIPPSEAEVAYRPVVEPDPAVRVYDVAVRRRSKAAAGDKLGRWLVPMYIIGALILILAGADAARLWNRQNQLVREVSVQERLDAEIQKIKGAAREKRTAAKAIRDRREASVKAQDEAARRRTMFSELLAVLAGSFSDQAVLRSLTSGKEGPSVRIEAVAATSQSAAEALTRLSAQASAKGWRVKTGSLSQHELGTTVAFDCEVSHD